MATKQVWVVESGEYSDYQVVGVFSSKENAEYIHAVLQNAGDNDVHDEVNCWTLDPCIDEIKKGLAPFIVIMLRDGDVERCERREISSYYLDPNTFWIWKRTEAPAYLGKGVPDALNATVWARDEKHAIKIANEHRTMMIANGEW